MKKLLLVLSLLILVNGTIVYANVDFTIERIGYEYIKDVAYNGEVCVAVGSLEQILFSKDFVNWEYGKTNNYDLYFYKVFWIGDCFFALSDPDFDDCNLYVSSDGIHWEFKSVLDTKGSSAISDCYILDQKRVF